MDRQCKARLLTLKALEKERHGSVSRIETRIDGVTKEAYVLFREGDFSDWIEVCPDTGVIVSYGNSSTGQDFTFMDTSDDRDCINWSNKQLFYAKVKVTDRVDDYQLD